MNKRAIQLVLLALAAITVGSLLSPVTAPAAPIDDKQAQAAQLEQQITENGRRLDALNEQINSAQIALDDANATIATANAQVAAAKAKIKDLRNELARRAVSVYQQGGSAGAVSDLDAKNATDFATPQVHVARRSAREATRQPTRARQGRSGRTEGRRRGRSRRRREDTGADRSNQGRSGYRRHQATRAALAGQGRHRRSRCEAGSRATRG